MTRRRRRCRRSAVHLYTPAKKLLRRKEWETQNTPARSEARDGRRQGGYDETMKRRSDEATKPGGNGKICAEAAATHGRTGQENEAQWRGEEV